MHAEGKLRMELTEEEHSQKPSLRGGRVEFMFFLSVSILWLKAVNNTGSQNTCPLEYRLSVIYTR